MVPFPHQSTVFLRLGKAGWYCVTKALFFLFVYLFSSNSCLPYFFSAPEQVFDKHMPQWCNLFEWIYRSGFPLFVSSGVRGRILRKRRWKLRNHDIHFQINVKWFEFGGNMWSCSLIVRVRVVFVGCGDWQPKRKSSSGSSEEILSVKCIGLVPVNWLVSLVVMLMAMRHKWRHSVMIAWFSVCHCLFF